ncbi:helix-turn-helix transcriptional regulator [Pararhizobium mangrovi]|uniref:AlpA family phage regulatory protein n=1 Tax=Pararhizobium mangrovi TaxID=2590452 RepID=A0A506TWR8_9HYPH|nr:AlpA family phage regulatory protein [Pararhizobium mangrovi]TPW25736.1 AlpA family phage regulatory protein [Pararhizobium mangrovi]
MPNAHHLPETGFVRLETVLALIPVSRSTIFSWIQQGRFPRQIRIGPRTSAWRAEDIRAVIEARAEAQQADQSTSSR